MLVGPVYPALPAKVAIVGEAPGADEDVKGVPFVGASGRLLDELLCFAGLATPIYDPRGRFLKANRSELMVTNVFQERPPSNKVDYFFSKEAQYKDNPRHPIHGYLKEPHVIPRLYSELEKSGARRVIVLGGTALWALVGHHKITEYRGTFLHDSTGKYELLPSYHPAAVLRDYGLRPILAMDLKKAKQDKPQAKRREVRIIENTRDMKAAVDEALDAPIICLDVETHEHQITCVSFAPSSALSYVVPIWNLSRSDYCHWGLRDEVELRAQLQRILCSSVPKLFQNGTYDLSLFTAEGFELRGPYHDTMLMSHSYQIEWPKDLGTLGSIYVPDMFAWKTMRTSKIKDRSKKDE